MFIGREGMLGRKTNDFIRKTRWQAILPTANFRCPILVGVPALSNIHDLEDVITWRSSTWVPRDSIVEWKFTDSSEGVLTHFDCRWQWDHSKLEVVLRRSDRSLSAL